MGIPESKIDFRGNDGRGFKMSYENIDRIFYDSMGRATIAYRIAPGLVSMYTAEQFMTASLDPMHALSLEIDLWG